jgi:hypothetical protein
MSDRFKKLIDRTSQTTVSYSSLWRFSPPDRARRRRSQPYAQLLTTSYLFGKFAPIAGGTLFGRKEVMALSGNGL